VAFALFLVDVSTLELYPRLFLGKLLDIMRFSRRERSLDFDHAFAMQALAFGSARRASLVPAVSQWSKRVIQLTISYIHFHFIDNIGQLPLIAAKRKLSNNRKFS
jgi:hypothetical protein